MSLFRVALNNTQQGTLDKNAYTGAQMAPSLQRQIYLTGPNNVKRLLKDGDTFTDCNYYKRFCPATTDNPLGCSLQDALLVIDSDDGTIWVDDKKHVNTVFRSVTKDIEAGSVYTTVDGEGELTNVIDLLDVTAVFLQLQNTHESQDITVRLNGSTDAVFTLEANSVQAYNYGDVNVSKIEFANNSSGATGPVTVEVQMSLYQVARS